MEANCEVAETSTSGFRVWGYLSGNISALEDGGHASDKLQKHNSEAVDVALVSQLVRQEILRIHVPRRAHYNGGDVVRSGALEVRHRRQAGESEVGPLWQPC